MKKFVIALVVLSFMAFSVSDLQARGIGIYGGMVFMQDDYEDDAAYDYENTYTIGILFDMGSFIFNSLIFRPAFDYVSCEGNEVDTWDKEVYGIHLDWYWHFMGSGSFSPFLGFGAALNYYEWNDDNINEDSDAGFELFAGFNYNITGSVALMIQGRFAYNDIASRDENMTKLLAGLIFKF